MAHARATRNEERFDINEYMDHVRINDDEGCFKFDDFADSLGLSKATRAILRKKELITIDALKSLSSADIKKLRLYTMPDRTSVSRNTISAQVSQALK